MVSLTKLVRSTVQLTACSLAHVVQGILAVSDAIFGIRTSTDEIYGQPFHFFRSFICDFL